jgi:predicted lipase
LPLVDYRFRPGTGLTHIGFQAVYETIRDSVIALVKKTAGLPVTVLGHSLGAALTTLCVLDEGLASAAGQRPKSVFPIASPRVGNGEFRDTFNNIVPDCIRIVNKPDLVPHLPLPIHYRHVGIAAIINSGATLDLGFAHSLCEGYARGLNRTIADPALVVRSADMGAEALMTI